MSDRSTSLARGRTKTALIRIKQPDDPVVDTNLNINSNTTLFNKGLNVAFLGTALGFPRETRPSLMALWGPNGGGWKADRGAGRCRGEPRLREFA